jgi:hypothetical protein
MGFEGWFGSQAGNKIATVPAHTKNARTKVRDHEAFRWSFINSPSIKGEVRGSDTPCKATDIVKFLIGACVCNVFLELLDLKILCDDFL